MEDREATSSSVFLFEKPDILIGYHLSADLRLPRASVGKQQLYLQLLGGRLFGHALPDQIPTLLRNEKLTFGWVTPDDEIEFGSYRLRSILNGIRSVLDEEEILENPLVSSSSSVPPIRFEHRASAPQIFRAVVNRTLSLVWATQNRANFASATTASRQFTVVWFGLLKASGLQIWVVGVESASTEIRSNTLCSNRVMCSSWGGIRLPPRLRIRFERHCRSSDRDRTRRFRADRSSRNPANTIIRHNHTDGGGYSAPAIGPHYGAFYRRCRNGHFSSSNNSCMVSCRCFARDVQAATRVYASRNETIPERQPGISPP